MIPYLANDEYLFEQEALCINCPMSWSQEKIRSQAIRHVIETGHAVRVMKVYAEVWKPE